MRRGRKMTRMDLVVEIVRQVCGAEMSDKKRTKAIRVAYDLVDELERQETREARRASDNTRDGMSA